MPGNLDLIPAWVVASWPKPNYVDPIRRSWLPAFAITWQTVSTALVCCRIYLRYRRFAGGFGYDDALMLLAWFSSVLFTATACVGAIHYGIDVHTWDSHPNNFVGAAFIGWIAQIMFFTSTCSTKLSVLLFYRRMVKDTYSRKWLYALWTAIALTAAFYVAMVVSLFLICQPLAAYWEYYDMHYTKPFKCIDGNALTLSSGILSSCSDLYAVLLPCLMLRHYHLDIPRRQRLALNFIFALGTLVAAAGGVRTYYLWKVNHTYDTNWAAFTLFIWAIVESQLAIICACAPSLRVFFRTFMKRGGPANYQPQSRAGTPRSPTVCESIASVRGVDGPGRTMTHEYKVSAETAPRIETFELEGPPPSAHRVSPIQEGDDGHWTKWLELDPNTFDMSGLSRPGSQRSDPGLSFDSYLDPRRKQEVESAV